MVEIKKKRIGLKEGNKKGTKEEVKHERRKNHERNESIKLKIREEMKEMPERRHGVVMESSDRHLSEQQGIS